MQKWIEVEFHLSEELAEPVAELLRRLAPHGVALELDGEGPGAQVRLRAWLPDDETLSSRRQTLEEGLWHLGQIRPIPEPSYRAIPEVGWSDAWRDLHHPLPIGERLVVLPPWAQPPQGPRIALTIEPGMAFGTGSHPTTRHCLEALENHLQPGALVADLGCGSGILSIAAAKLGARLALAYDSDPVAVEAARDNVVRNQLQERVSVGLGSLAELRQHPAVRQQPPQLLLANIHAGVLETLLADGLAELVGAEGTVVLSGILEEQAEELTRHAEAHGLRLQQTLIGGDWRTLILKRKPPMEAKG